MRASLSLNPESFTRRFAMIPCAAGSVFQTVDVMMNAPENASNFDWAFIFVNSSQQTSSDAEDRSIIRCANCRSIARKFFVRGPAHIWHLVSSSAATQFGWMTWSRRGVFVNMNLIFSRCNTAFCKLTTLAATGVASKVGYWGCRALCVARLGCFARS
jgi:hypothetical protein